MQVGSAASNSVAQSPQPVAQAPVVAKKRDAEDANESASAKAAEAAKSAPKPKNPDLGRNVDTEA